MRSVASSLPQNSVMCPMTVYKADLHCHSSYSDGTDTPTELVKLAKQIGLFGLSITDHDTLDAYPEAEVAAAAEGIALLPGIEFSAHHRGEAVHILGYAFSLSSLSIQTLCARHKSRRAHRNHLIIKKLKKLGIALDEEKLAQEKGSVGRPHLARLMVEQGIVASIQEAFIRYLGEGKPAYDPGEPFSVIETLEAIHASQGKAIIAHPHLCARSDLLYELFDLPFDGIEGYYGHFPRERALPWVTEAKKRGWIVTGGSDYHGGTKPHSFLGSSWVDLETWQKLEGPCIKESF